MRASDHGALRVLVVLLSLAATGVQAQVQRTFVNPGFEAPALPGPANCWLIVPDANVPGWRTTEPTSTRPLSVSTAGDCGPEFWATLPIIGAMQIFKGTGGTGFRPNEGNQYAELNAYTPARLYQQVCLLEGEQVDWSLAHRARSSANEVAVFNIGANGSGSGSQEIVRMRAGNTVAEGPVACGLGTCRLDSIDSQGWREYSGSFRWNQPSGLQTIGFQAISGGSLGNVLDDIRIGLRPFVEIAQPAYTQNEHAPDGNRPQVVVAGSVPAGGLTVQVTITGGTATFGLDYTTASGTTDVPVFVPAGEYERVAFPVPITIVNDGPGDPGETITLGLPDAAGTGADYNVASLQACGAAPRANATSTISEDPNPLPRIQLNKALSAERLNINDQFQLSIAGTNGRQTTTTGTGSTVANGSILVGPGQAGSVYTLAEAMSAGSASPLAAYEPSIACTNATPNATTVLPSGAGSSFTLTVGDNDNISCVFTNRVATAPAFIELVKSVDSGAFYGRVGDVATYRYLVTNTGSVPVDSLVVVDDKIAAVTCPDTTLAAAPGPGNSTTCTASHVVTAADMNDMLVTNLARASARNTTNGEVAIATDDAVISLAFPRMTADKQTTATSYSTAGQVIRYTYVLANTGNVDIGGLSVTDDRIANVTCPVSNLPVGATTTCSGDYTVTQADIDAGVLTNVMEATGTPQAGTLAVLTDSVTLVGPAATPAMTLDKRSTGSTFTAAGQVLAYDYVVANTGEVTITALQVGDDRIATVSCPVATLAPGASTTCTASYTVTQQDMDAGTLTNTATATGTPARGVLAPVADSVTMTATAAPALTLDKTVASGQPYDAVGDVVDYRYVVTNTGNVTIDALAVSDDRIASVACPVSTLAPGSSATCTASHTITQDDLDAGSVTNRATATGRPTRGTLSPATDEAIVTATASPALTLAKTIAAGDPYDQVGDLVDYRYTVTNTGNVRIDALQVIDDRIANIACPVTTLAPGASTTCTASDAITQAELDAGSVTNRASATGTPTQGTLTPAHDSATASATALPSLALDKRIVAGNPYDAAGDVVGYAFVVANTGNVTIDALAVRDDRIATVACPVTTLAPGASTTCTADYTIVQADVNAGLVTNVANATGTPASGTLAPATDSETAASSATPSLQLEKTAVSGAPYDAVGDIVQYDYRVTNPSAVSIHTLTVTDDRIATVDCPDTTLDPGDAVTCTAAYTTTQGDIDAGAVTNIATAAGASDNAPVVPDTDTATVASAAVPALTLDKSVVSGSPFGAAGDVIAYRYVVANTGVVTITDLRVTDDRIAAVACPTTILAPDASVTCTASYTVTQADVDAGAVANIATATGSPSTSATDSATVLGTPAPAITLRKAATRGMPYDRVGAIVEYQYDVANTGNITIDALTVTDDRIANVTCPATRVAPGATLTCRASHTVTQADLDVGAITNHARASGMPAHGTLVPALDDETVTATLAPGLSLVKTAVAGEPFDAVGDAVDYEYLITNTGNVTIDRVSVSDDRIASVQCPVASLPSRASTTCAARYTITQADLDAGAVTNHAVATGTPARGTLAPAAASATVLAAGTPMLALDKTAVAGDPYAAAGDVVDYTYLVSNTGNVTIDALRVADDRIATVACPSTTIAPRESITCTGRYTITQADLDAGSVTNVAVADGTPASGTLAPATDTVTVYALPRVTYAKTVDAADPVAAGDILTYTLSVTVAQAATAHPLTLTDTPGPGLRMREVTAPGPFACNDAQPLVCTLPAGTPPGTYALTYTATVTNDASRVVRNTVVGTSDPGDPIPPTCGANCTIETPLRRGTVVVSKWSDPDPRTQVTVGQAIEYTLTLLVRDAATTGDIVLSDIPDAGLTIGAVPPGCVAHAKTIACTLPAGSTVGTHTFVYTMTVNAQAGLLVNNHVVFPSPRPVDPPVSCLVCSVEHPMEPTNLRLAKSVAVRRARVGDLVRYALSIENLGDAPLVGGEVTDTPAPGFHYVEGSLRVDDGDDHAAAEGTHPVRFTGIDIAPGGTATLVYLLRVGAGVPHGAHENAAQAVSPTTHLPISNIATATVAVERDPLLDDSLVFGTVFNDRDGDGWQAVDEPGLPGVRIASVEGVLVETDRYGRFHFEGMQGGPDTRGRNVLLKVDPATLPPGAVFTTANPLLRRITPGLPVRFDWGVQLPLARDPIDAMNR